MPKEERAKFLTMLKDITSEQIHVLKDLNWEEMEIQSG